MFRQKHKNSIVRAVLKQVVEHNRQVIINRLIEYGEYFMSTTHSQRGYNNDTYNLSSGKGYMVFDNGVKVKEGGFESLASSANSGPKLGKAIAVREVPKKGIALVIVAGERYAAYVEATGRNVLSGEAIVIESKVKQMIDEMK